MFRDLDLKLFWYTVMSHKLISLE